MVETKCHWFLLLNIFELTINQFRFNPSIWIWSNENTPKKQKSQINFDQKWMTGKSNTNTFHCKWNKHSKLSRSLYHFQTFSLTHTLSRCSFIFQHFSLTQSLSPSSSLTISFHFTLLFLFSHLFHHFQAISIQLVKMHNARAFNLSGCSNTGVNYSKKTHNINYWYVPFKTLPTHLAYGKCIFQRIGLPINSFM